MRVLFICPHGAAKSAIAAYRLRAAAAAGALDVDVDFAGPDPDAVIVVEVVDALAALGHHVEGVPRRVTVEDIESADLVVTLGCPIEDLPMKPKSLLLWDHIPMPSAGLAEAIAAVDNSIPDLIARLEHGEH